MLTQANEVQDACLGYTPAVSCSTPNTFVVRYSLAKEFYDAYKKYASNVQPGVGCEQHELDGLPLVVC